MARSAKPFDAKGVGIVCVMGKQTPRFPITQFTAVGLDDIAIVDMVI